MLRFFVVSCFFLSSAFGASYQIRLGSFESYAELQASLSKLQDQAYKQKLSIEQDEVGFTLYSRVYTQKSHAQRAFVVYSEVFQEASMQIDGVDAPSPKNTVSTQQNTQSGDTLDSQENSASKRELWGSVQTHAPQISPSNTQSRNNPLPKPQNPVPQQQKNLSFAKELKRKVFYLCYEGKRQGRIKPVIKAVFNQNFITYSSEMMEIPPIITPYRLAGNDLHVTVGMFSVGSTKSRLERVTDTYLRVINWADGKPVQPVRFYYNQRDAVLFSRKN